MSHGSKQSLMTAFQLNRILGIPSEVDFPQGTKFQGQLRGTQLRPEGSAQPTTGSAQSDLFSEKKKRRNGQPAL
jgi:hypothetical protein